MQVQIETLSLDDKAQHPTGWCSFGTMQVQIETLSLDDKAQHPTEWCSGNIGLDKMTKRLIKILLKKEMSDRHSDSTVVLAQRYLDGHVRMECNWHP